MSGMGNLTTRRPELPGIPPAVARPTVPPQPPPRYDPVNRGFWDNVDSDDTDEEEDLVRPQHHAHAPALHREQLVAEADPMLQREPDVVPDVPVQVEILEAADPIGAEEDEQVDGAQQDQQLESDLEDDEGIAAGDVDADVEDNDLDIEGEPHLDQSRQPTKGEIVSFREGGARGHWIEARVISACTGRNRFYYNVVTLDTAEEYGVWLKPPQVTATGHQEAWHLGGRQDFMRSPTRPPSRRVSFGSSAREESATSDRSLLDLTAAEMSRVLSLHSL